MIMFRSSRRRRVARVTARRVTLTNREVTASLAPRRTGDVTVSPVRRPALTHFEIESNKPTEAI